MPQLWGRKKVESKSETNLRLTFRHSSEAALNLLEVFYSPVVMFQTKTRIESVLDLSARLVEKNKAFTTALKARKPQEELKTIHSEIQELYNHISLLNSGGRRAV